MEHCKSPKERFVRHYCGEYFGSDQHLKKHVQDREQGLGNSECSRHFSYQSFIERHRSYVREPPKICNVPDQKNRGIYRSDEHLRSNTGERPYTCDECNARFKDKRSLLIHARSHTGERPYTCDECNKSFRQRGHLVRHALTHTGKKPYTCDECNARFPGKNQLLRHAQTHIGEQSSNPYNCDACNDTFSQENRLISHRLTHTQDKTYDFSSSGQMLTTKTNLNVCIQSCTTNKDNVTMIFENLRANAENNVPTVIEANIKPIGEAGFHSYQSVPQEIFEPKNRKPTGIAKGEPLSHRGQSIAEVQCYPNPAKVSQCKDNQSSSESLSSSGHFMFKESLPKQCDINVRNKRFTLLENGISQKRITPFYR